MIRYDIISFVCVCLCVCGFLEMARERERERERKRTREKTNEGEYVLVRMCANEKKGCAYATLYFHKKYFSEQKHFL